MYVEPGFNAEPCRAEKYVQKHVQEAKRSMGISVLRGFMQTPCRAEKHVQEDKRNMRWTELGYLASRTHRLLLR
jgi:hypothetical protein